MSFIDPEKLNLDINLESSVKEEFKFIKKEIKKRTIIFCLITVILIIGSGYMYTHNYMLKQSIQNNNVATFFFGISMWSIILGSIFSFIPYKTTKYKNRFLYVCSMVQLILYSFITISALITYLQ
jgi:uncharacterized membrane protein